MDDTQTEFDQIIAGFEPEPVGCARRGHAAGLAGCEKDQHAGYVIATHQCGHAGRPGRILVCQGAAIRFRSERNAPRTCAPCGIRGIESDFVEVLGPLPKP